MRRVPIFLTFVLIGLNAFFVSVRPASADSYGADVCNALNGVRAGAGLSGLAWNQNLANAAQSYADYLAASGHFDHNAPDGSSPVSRAQAAGYPGYNFVGENIAKGYPTGQATVDAWQASPSHRANDLRPEYGEVGIGVARATNGQIVAVAEFGSQAYKQALSAPAQPMPTGLTFVLGFANMASKLGGTAGSPTENERHAANGDALQQTSSGLMVWRKADNWTAFTNGSRTWVNGPNGVQERANDQRFSWEAR